MSNETFSTAPRVVYLQLVIEFRRSIGIGEDDVVTAGLGTAEDFVPAILCGNQDGKILEIRSRQVA